MCTTLPFFSLKEEVFVYKIINIKNEKKIPALIFVFLIETSPKPNRLQGKKCKNVL